MSDSNNNFSDVKRLLKLKQYEVPPPGYFNNFSGDVISRIQAGETTQFEGNSFLTSVLQLFQAKPGVIGGFATSVCLMLLIGVVVMTERPDGGATASDITGLQSVPSDGTVASALVLAPADSSSGISISSNSLVSLQPTVPTFSSQQSQNPLFQTVGFATGQ